MNIFPGKDSIENFGNDLDHDLMIRLSELLVFIDAYLGREKQIEASLKALTPVNADFFSGKNSYLRPYAQFHISQLENLLVTSLSASDDDVPHFTLANTVLIASALDRLSYLASEPARTSLGYSLMSVHKIDRVETILDGASDMALQLVTESFGKEAILPEDTLQFSEWEIAFSGAIQMLRRYLPEGFSYIRNNLKVVIPVLAKEERISLSSTPSYINGVFLASWVTSRELSEAIIHEVSHDILNQINTVNPLFVAEAKGYYSPFRIDTRPVSGLVHAAYSFLSVCQLLKRVLDSEPRLAVWAESKLQGYLFNTLLCIRMVENGNELTVAGKELLLEMYVEVNALCLSTGFKLERDVLASKRQHFDAWVVTAKIDSFGDAPSIFESVVAAVSIVESASEGPLQPSQVSTD